MLVQTDARRHALSSRVERPPTAGAALELTIDQYLQHIAERELRAGVEENRAAGGTAIIMDPHTGEILALANWPTFNPNAFGRADDDARRNRAVQDLYEPGSTFKIVTASAALEEQVIAPDRSDRLRARATSRSGSRSRSTTRTSYGTLSFTDVIVKSSNVGAIKVGLRLGPERLGRYVSRFGFGQALAPDFRGENAGIVWNPARLDASALASVSMGYQVGVTPLQMAAAVSSVANGGDAASSRASCARSSGTAAATRCAPKVLRRAISAETAATLTDDHGSGRRARHGEQAAQIEGYTIAGKTGTAAKLVNGRYSKSDYNASFVGFVPSRQPALTIIVVIDSPHANGYSGGTVAAPIFKRIAEASLRHLGDRPDGQRAAAGARRAPRPAAPTAMRPQPVRAPAIGRAPDRRRRRAMMPDLRGLSAREALRTLTRIGLTARITGDGFVVEQSPQPGAAARPAATPAVLTLGRRPAMPAGGTP